MQPNYQQYTNPNPRVVALYRWVVFIGLLICVWLVVLAAIGYGHLSISAPTGALVTLNGHAVNKQNLKLRSGTYQVGIQSGGYYSSYKNVKVSAFTTSSYKPALTRRTATSVMTASSVSLRGAGTTDAIWLDNDTWLVTISGVGGAAVFASHYTGGHWQLEYGGSSTQDASKLPADVSSAVSRLTEKLSAYN